MLMYRTQYIYVQWFKNNINSSRSSAYIIGYKVLHVMVHIIKKNSNTYLKLKTNLHACINSPTIILHQATFLLR